MRKPFSLSESLLTRSNKNSIFRHLTTARILLLGFAIIILVGSLLLMLPFSTKEGVDLKFIDALFTATSATCVTGLIVAPTADTFTVFGQVVILLLIQIGGLGFMTLTSFFYSMIGRKFTLRRLVSMSEDMQSTGMGKLKSIAIKIVILAFGVELIGAILLTIGFCIEGYSFGKSLWFGIFHSISAFCNAGFDVVSLTGTSLTSINDNYLVLITLALLIGIGGIGFIVLIDISENKRFRRLSLHTKIVIIMTLIFAFGGAFVIWIAERNNPDTIGNLPLFGQWVNSSSMLLMFVGAAPGSTGGGIKVTTVYILGAQVFATLKNKKEFVVDMKAIGTNTLTKAITVLSLALTVMLTSMFVLLLVENNVEETTMTALIFEQISAYATCGLSLGVTPLLSPISKIVIMLNMYLGRIGAFTFFMSFTRSIKQVSKIRYPEANVTV